MFEQYENKGMNIELYRINLVPGNRGKNSSPNLNALYSEHKAMSIEFCRIKMVTENRGNISSPNLDGLR